jgi:dihydroorotase
MAKTLLKGGKIVNEGKIFEADLLINGDIIEKIGTSLNSELANTVIDVSGKFIIPGIIDDQVHFREPGLTHKANIASESKAAVAGGTTSFMEMPNTVPNALSQTLLNDKYEIAAKSSLANYSFFMGTSNDNYEEVMKTDLKNVCGLKIFMGSSTGNMLVDNENTLVKIFKNFGGLIATHCEDEATVKANLAYYKDKYSGTDLPYDIHCLIRNEEACYKSSEMAVRLAKQNGTRLHILHISTSQELDLFDNTTSLQDKKISSEVCVHHLFFDAEDYKDLGPKIKCNPAIKHNHKENLLKALLDNRLDIIATDHAPHTIDEKSHGYWDSHAGLPLVQHSLNLMLDFYHKGKISLEKIVEKMSHAPAICFRIENRGFIREGFKADLAVVDINAPIKILKENIEYKCGWSPLEGKELKGKVIHTFVSGHLAYQNGVFNDSKYGERMSFNR